MKRFYLPLLAVLTVLALAGCATGGIDREAYGRMNRIALVSVYETIQVSPEDSRNTDVQIQALANLRLFLEEQLAAVGDWEVVSSSEFANHPIFTDFADIANSEVIGRMYESGELSSDGMEMSEEEKQQAEMLQKLADEGVILMEGLGSGDKRALAGQHYDMIVNRTDQGNHPYLSDPGYPIIPIQPFMGSTENNEYTTVHEYSPLPAGLKILVKELANELGVQAVAIVQMDTIPGGGALQDVTVSVGNRQKGGLTVYGRLLIVDSEGEYFHYSTVGYGKIKAVNKSNLDLYNLKENSRAELFFEDIPQQYDGIIREEFDMHIAYLDSMLNPEE